MAMVQLDPSLIGQGGGNAFTNAYQAALANSMKNQQNQQEYDLNNLKIQEHQTGVAKTNALNAIYQGAGGDSDKIISGLNNAGYGGEAQAYQKQLTDVSFKQAETGKQKVDAEKLSAEVVDKKLSTYRDLLNTVQNPQQAAQWLRGVYSDPHVAPVISSVSSYEDAASRIGQDPQSFALWKQQASLGADKLAQALHEKVVSDETARHNLVGENKPQIIQQNLGDKTNIVSVDPYGKTAPTLLSSSTVNQSPDNVANKKVQLQIAGLDDSGAPSADVGKLVDAIGTYSMAPPSAMALSRPRMQAILAQVAEKYPEYDATQYGAKVKAMNDFSTGKNGNAVRSFNTALNHLDTLSELNNALKNNDIQAINKVSNYFSQQTGSPAVTNFNAAKQIVGDEIVKAIVGGGGGVGDREKAQQVLDAANSPDQLAGVINKYKELMGGQLEGLQHQYEANTGRTDFQKRFLTPKGQAAANAPQAQDLQKAAAANPALAARLKALGY
jgi:hypothetical protein